MVLLIYAFLSTTAIILAIGSGRKALTNNTGKEWYNDHKSN